MNILEGASIITKSSQLYPKQDGSIFSRGNQWDTPPCPPSARATHLLHTVSIIPKSPRMPGRDGTPRPSRWRLRRLHDDAGVLCVVINNQISGSRGHRKLFYCAYNRHHRHWPKIRRKEMENKEEPTGHLPQHVHRPPKTIQESHRSRIPFRSNDEHRHGEVSIWQQQTRYGILVLDLEHYKNSSC